MTVVGAVVCFGEALVDMRSTGLEADGTERYVRHAGGAPANAAVAVARQGGDARFVGMLARDAFGDFLLHSLAHSGVDVSWVRRTDAANTALAFVSLDADGERSFMFYRPPAADLLFEADHFDDDCFAGIGIFHVCSNSLTEEGIADATFAGMTLARRAGALVSIDLNLRPSLWANGKPVHARLWSALERADLVKLSREELEFLQVSTQEASDVIAHLLQHARLVLVTDGAAPIRWWTRTQQGRVTPPQVQAIDTTAAGDAFIGGLLAMLQREHVDAEALDDFLGAPDRLQAALHHAAACGALAVTRHGAFASLPTHAEAVALRASSLSATH